MNHPTVSVIIPMYNAAPFIGETLAGVLDQSPQPNEIIVVDDGSVDDGAVQVAALAATHPQVILLRRPHAGIAATINHGLAHAQGDILAFLDADDIWLPGKQAAQLAAFAADPALDLVFGYARQFDWRIDPATGRSERVTRPGIWEARIRPAMLARRRAFDRVGYFNTDPDCHDFFEWYARAEECGLSMRVLPDVVYERRIHGGNISIVGRDLQRHRQLQSLKRTLDRRRGVG